MKRSLKLTVLSLLVAVVAHAAAPPLDAGTIETATGAKGAFDAAHEVFKVTVPRTDLAVTVAGVHLVPAQGLASWAAFTRAGDHIAVMGDLVLLDDQVNPVMSAALDNGLDVTALHNHFLWDTPRVMFMHIGGMGDEQTLAAAVGKVFARLAATAGGRGDTPHADIDASRTTLDAARLDAALGVTGALAGGVYKIVVGRTARMHGHAMGAAMGVNTWAAFAGSDSTAVVDGDIAMHPGELQAVLRALRHAGIDVVAIHHHMVDEDPRFVFLHYWGVGPVTQLTGGVRAALDLTR